MERDFKGIWIPKEIWLDKDLSLIEKVVFIEIDSLDKEKHCFAGNKYFSEFFGVTETRVSQIISSLVKKGYINQLSFDGRTRLLSSNLKVILKQTLENFKAGLNESFEQDLEKNEADFKDPTKQPLEKAIHNNTSNKPVKNKEDIRERKSHFFNLLNSFKSKNRGKYPDLLYEKFFSFYTEIDELKGGKFMRFENKKKYEFFEIGKRIATFWTNTNEEQRAGMWKAQEARQPVPQAQLNFGEILKTSSEEWK